jgi:hypothetical protein
MGGVKKPKVLQSTKLHTIGAKRQSQYLQRPLNTFTNAMQLFMVENYRISFSAKY